MWGCMHGCMHVYRGQKSVSFLRVLFMASHLELWTGWQPPGSCQSPPACSETTLPPFHTHLDSGPGTQVITLEWQALHWQPPLHLPSISSFNSQIIHQYSLTLNCVYYYSSSVKNGSFMNSQYSLVDKAFWGKSHILKRIKNGGKQTWLIGSPQDACSKWTHPLTGQ